MLLRNHLLGKPRELSVHPLVETPRLDDWKPEGVELIEDKPSSLNSATQPRRVDYVKLKAVLFQKLPSRPGLIATLVGERSVFPSGKKAEFVVGRLTVPYYNNHGVLTNGSLEGGDINRVRKLSDAWVDTTTSVTVNQTSGGIRNGGRGYQIVGGGSSWGGG